MSLIRGYREAKLTIPGPGRDAVGDVLDDSLRRNLAVGAYGSE
jgi:hypothetical protein